MSILQREEGETTMNWVSQKKLVENGGVVIMSRFAQLPYVYKYFGSRIPLLQLFYLTDEEIEAQST